jgi:hypothetical protein
VGEKVTRFVKTIAIALMLGSGVVAQANAAAVKVDPASQTVMTGDPVSVDIVVSGLGELIGGYSAVLSFDGSKLIYDSHVTDPDGNFDGVIDLSFGIFDGLDLLVVGDPAPGQPASFVLARISFTAQDAGLTELALSGVVLSDESGENDMFPDVENGEVCIADQAGNTDLCQRVPEPTFLALMGAGLGALAVRRRRAAKSQA